MLKRIRAKDLKVGMYVVKYGRGDFRDPEVSVERPMLSEQAIRDSIPENVSHVWIDDKIDLDIKSRVRPARAADVAEPEPGPGMPEPQVPLQEEIAEVEEDYVQAVSYAKVFMDDVRRGKPLDVRQAEPMVDRFIQSVYRNPRAAATLAKLRRFDEYTFTHSINVGVLAIVLGRHLGLNKNALKLLGVAGLFHDTGKARIPEDILNKPGKLSPEEFEVMKAHPQEGYDVLQGQKGLHPEVLKAALEHHERNDGQGYPRGLTGKDMGRLSRLISVVDVYDALTSKRVYKDAMPPIQALGLMYQWRDTDFYPSSVEHFIKCMGVYPVGSFVELSTGEYGVVTEITPGQPLFPRVKVIFNREMLPRRERMVDMWALREAGKAPPSIERCLNPAEYKVDLGRYFQMEAV